MRLLTGEATVAPRSHHLVAAATEIPDRCAPDMHETGEWEHQENRHAEEEMQLEDRMRIGDERGDAGLQRQNSLGPSHELHHLMAVEVPERHKDGGEAQDQLRVEQQQNCNISERRCFADARIEQPPMHQQRGPDKAHHARDTSDDDRHPLFERVRDTENVKNPDRREQTDEMTEEDDEDADVKQVRTPH